MRLEEVWGNVSAPCGSKVVEPTRKERMPINRITRRRALRNASIAVTGILAAPAVHAAGNETLRLGMVGCGGRCSGAAMDAMTADEGTRLTAMCDLFAPRIEAKLASLKAQKPQQVQVTPDRCFTGLDGFRRVIESCDVVLIACAAKFHPMYALEALRAGKHVFVEKPHGIDPAGVQTMRQAAQLAGERKLGLLSGLHSRYSDPIRQTIQRIQEGWIGEVVSMEENFIRTPYGNAARPQGLRELEVQYANQYRFSWLSGDDVTQSLVHNLDRATWAMNETPPVKCHGLGGRAATADLLGDVFDHHSVVYQYASGARLYAFCRTSLNCYNENSSIVRGTRGVAYPLNGRITGEKPWTFEGESESPYLLEHRAFLKSIRDGAPINCGEYMARSTLVAVMGQLSCYSGKEATWEKASQSKFAFAPRPESCTWEMEPPTKPDQKGIYPVCATPGTTTNL